MTPHRHRLLVIDDAADARRALQELFELHDYGVATAADGEEGLACLRAGYEPCLILLDLRMPGMNGWRFRDEQVRDPELREVPVVVFSGDAQEEEAAQRLGLRHYLRKPVDFDRLFGLLERYCRGAGATCGDESPSS